MSPPRRIAVAAMYVVPGVAIASACAILLFGRARTGLAARIYGGPPGPDGVAAWRVVAVERTYAIETPLRGVGVQLVAADGSREVSAQGVTDDEGAWEARVDVGKAANMRLLVRTLGPQSRVIAAGQILVHSPSWQAALRLDPLPIPGQVTGQLSITISPARGILASPYPEEVVVQVRARGQPAADVRVSAGGQGLSIDGPESITTDHNGIARLRLRATDHDVHLNIQARAASGEQGEWSGQMPVMPGGLWLDPAASVEGRVLLQSPVAHRFAYVTSITRTARLSSQRIALKPDRGGAVGTAELAAPPRDGWILLSPDPPGREANAIGWPVPPSDGSPRASVELRTPLLVDGIPMAEQQMKRQSMRTRSRALTVLGLAAVLESALLWWRAKQEREEAEAAVAHQPDLGEALRSSLSSGAAFWMRMVIAMAIVAVGFFSVALVTWIGTR
jgi:hypothetical protein